VKKLASEERRSRRPVPVVDDPVLALPPDEVARYNARVLDPPYASRAAGDDPIRSTVYVGHRLLISGAASTDAREALDEAADEHKLRLHPPAVFRKRRKLRVEAARKLGRDDADSLFIDMHHLEPVKGQAAPPDAFKVMQSYRAMVGPDSEEAGHVSLDHLLTATRFSHGSPFPSGPQSWAMSPTASASYGVAGWGGRQPVNWVGPPPQRRTDDELGCRRPVVAILDTGIGKHPWLAEGVVRNVRVHGHPVGLTDKSTDPERTGVVKDPLEGILDPDAGHGTFIAGLIRQQAPDADILSIRVMPSDGAVPEHVLHDALVMLQCRQEEAQASGRAEDIVDIVCLSLGYYPELVLPGSRPFLFEPIEALGRCGVAVVAAAGNDATTREMYPAGFAPHRGGCVEDFDRNCVPVVSVGAENPDGTVALFSNSGPWVTCTAPGAALVSTFPKFQASAQAAFRFQGPDGVVRSTIDPDDFTSGFAIWSGTSFAAPVVAGRMARSLVDGKCGPIDAVDAKSMRKRGWAAVRAHTPVKR
jgi:hypothetical protein